MLRLQAPMLAFGGVGKDELLSACCGRAIGDYEANARLLKPVIDEIRGPRPSWQLARAAGVSLGG